MVLRRQSDRRERAVKSPPEQFRDIRALRMLDERELAIRRGKRDARENTVILRQILIERLAAPEHRGAGAKAELRPTDLDWRNIERLVIDRQIRQPDQLFRVVLLAVGRFHQIAREVIIEGWESAGIGVAPGIALDERQ